MEWKEAKSEVLLSIWKQVLHSHDQENLGKFDAKSDEGIFLGYSTSSRAYRVYNKRTKTIMESINVKIDDAITKVEMVDDGEGPSTKEPTVEVEALDGKGIYSRKLKSKD